MSFDGDFDARGLPTVHVRRPVPLRERTLPGMKKMLCPPVDKEAFALFTQMNLALSYSVWISKAAFALSLTNVFLLLLLNVCKSWPALLPYLPNNFMTILVVLLSITPGFMLAAHLHSDGHDDWSVRAMILYLIVCPLLGILSTYMG